MTNLNTILRIARAGNPARAMRVFDESGLAGGLDDPKALTLKGRLLKDLARLAEGDEQQALYGQALEAYLAAFALEATTYALINAATIAFEAGRLDQSKALAQQVLDMLEANPSEGETPYWREATRAEALLLLSKVADAQASLKKAIALQPLAHEDQAATIRQCARIIELQRGDALWLDDCRPPASLHFSGMIGLDHEDPELLNRIATLIENAQPGYAYGALAAGADILIAEEAVRHGAELNVVLPQSPTAFRSLSVEPYGAHWGARFDALIDKAMMVDVVGEHLELGLRAYTSRIELASLTAMGRCQRNAEILSSAALSVTIAAPGEPERELVSQWIAAGGQLERIEAPRVGPGAQVSAHDTPLPLVAIAQVNGCDQQVIEALAQERGLNLRHDRESALVSGQPREMLGFLRSCLAKFENCRAGLLMSVMDAEGLDPHLRARLSLLSRIDGLAQVMTDEHSALASKALEPGLRIEETGEITSLEGPISLWMVQFPDGD
ncbi:MAG: tetratricopeptide repeat-containing protein [Pseudomonadota bacterium]